MWRVLRVGSATIILLCLCGWAVAPLHRIGWDAVRASQPEMNLADIEGALGQGVLVGFLGGFRTIIADFMYIRMNSYWEQRDRPKTESMIQLITAVDPRPMFFWRNGAKIIAYDIPVWRLREQGYFEDVPEGVRRRVNAEQAERGLAVLDRALEFHPDNALLYLEKAQIYLGRLEDRSTAAEYYLKASQMPNAPYYAARIYAEMLRQLGRKEEALAHLKSILPDLPADVPAAQRSVVLHRINELEREIAGRNEEIERESRVSDADTTDRH